MYKYLATLIFFLLFSLVSCNRTESKISSADAELTHAEQSGTSLVKEDWEALEAQMEELQADLDANRSNYTDEQIKEVGKLQGRYTALVLKKGIKDLKESFQDATHQLEGFMEGIQK